MASVTVVFSRDPAAEVTNNLVVSIPGRAHGRAGASGAEEARQGAGRLEAGGRQQQEAAALKAELPSRGELHDGGSRGALALGVASEQTLGVARQTNTLNQYFIY